MKLEIKHLDNYLSHKLMCVRNGSNPVELVGLRFGNEAVNNELWIWEEGKQYLTGYLYECKPILRPLSDLTKEIEINGEKFVPIDWLEEKYYTLDLHKQCLQLINDTGEWIYQCDYMLVEHLFEWHFDVFGLIDQNLAIAIND